MKFMLMMHAPKGSWSNEGIAGWPMEDLMNHIRFMKDFSTELAASGVLVGAEGLAGPDEAKVVRAQNGQTAPAVTDGPFPETKEFLAGYWIVDVENEAQAYAIAGKASAAPGKGGVPLNMPIEVRQVMSAPPVEV
jgi:hypothetical protein